MALRTKRADGIDLTDPVEQVSMAGWFALSVALLLISTVWAIYVEMIGLRPWKAVQADFKTVASIHLQKKLRKAQEDLAQVRGSAEFKAAQAAVAQAEKDLEGAQDARNAKVEERDQKQEELNRVRSELKVIRAEYQAAIYQWEQAEKEARMARERAHSDEIYGLPEAEQAAAKARFEAEEKKIAEEAYARFKAKIGDQEQSVESLIGRMKTLGNEVNRLAQEIFAFGTDLQKARAKEAEFASQVATLSGMLDTVKNQEIGIVQYYVPDLDHATDRCATCHIGAVTPGLEDIGETIAGLPEYAADKEQWESLFRTHPGDHLMKHPPEQFGCTSCHAGDGYSLSTTWESHGTHHHHEAPLHRSPPNAPKAFGHVAEAGCNKCHLQELDLEGAPLLSFGKQLFTETCAGCHKAKGIWPEADRLDAALKNETRLSGLLMQAKVTAQAHKAEQARLDELLDEEKITDEQYDAQDKALAAKRNENRIEQVRLDDQVRLAKEAVKGAHKDIRWIGPDLRNVKDKLRPDWLKEWLLDPHAFSAETKMPNFYLNDNDAESLAAYLWQSAKDPAASSRRSPPQDEATIEEGKRLFEKSGCLACHVGGGEAGEPIDIRPTYGVGEDGQPIRKRGFGPALLRTGEKARFDWLSRWIYDPHKLSPGTRMPNMRLQKKQADAIAAWLVSQKQEDTTADQWNGDVPDYLEDEAKYAKGYQLVQRYGCYSCHAVADAPPESEQPKNWEPGGLMSERFGRIGVELSAHGSKTLHLFDFGLIEHKVEANMWGEEYHPHADVTGNHPHKNMTRFDYIAYKAWKPRDFETGRYYTGPDDEAHLRMPSLNLTREEAHAVSTFVISLTEEPVPEKYIYKPGYPGGPAAEGRNLTVKHNCIACHTMERDRGGHLRQRYDDKNNAPPTLVGEGRKVQPDWLFEFMKQPVHLRPWLEVRMPYFDLSDYEARAFAAYFQAVDDQPYPYVYRKKPELTASEEAEAKGILVGQCQRCHSLEEAYDPKSQAPPLNLSKKRIKPEYIAPWVLNPQRFLPYTRMPNLNLTPEQANLVAAYLQTLNVDPVPQGAYVADELHRAHPPALITEN